MCSLGSSSEISISIGHKSQASGLIVHYASVSLNLLLPRSLGCTSLSIRSTVEFDYGKPRSRSSVSSYCVTQSLKNEPSFFFLEQSACRIIRIALKKKKMPKSFLFTHRRYNISPVPTGTYGFGSTLTKISILLFFYICVATSVGVIG